MLAVTVARPVHARAHVAKRKVDELFSTRLLVDTPSEEQQRRVRAFIKENPGTDEKSFTGSESLTTRQSLVQLSPYTQIARCNGIKAFHDFLFLHKIKYYAELKDHPM